ncbi:MAG: hypothetical protein ACRD4Y_11480, partial [Candidatus Acidiferrales bacterium]
MSTPRSCVPVRIQSGIASLAFIICVSFFLAACGGSPNSYILTGRVINKEPATQQLVINNDDIPGFMSAMTMPYAVKDPEGFK